MEDHRHLNTQRIGRIEKYWISMDNRATNEPLDYKNIHLPLARIKRLMKVEEGVKMVASEVPILFSKVTENFIEELALRSWINTDENKRRILQRNDILAAIKTSDVYDFLIYIVPKSSALDNTLGKISKINMVDTPNNMGGIPIDAEFSTDEVVRGGRDFYSALEQSSSGSVKQALSMASSLERTFLKHLETIYEKYGSANDKEEDGVDLSHIDKATWSKVLSSTRKEGAKPPQLFLFIRKKRKGNTQTKRYKFVDTKREFENLYRIHHGNPSLADLYWLTDNYWSLDNLGFIKR
ncbi:UNVERIFIED_CONTAM: hypothetical protein PYX00_011258 [Menopon gallinae]|uniref:Transcription factor CBF/NF-Y/archaeal histone domain-containing protein n=1 Tax=Menopon gallinae TaxID=328185 RepID=A0AAW2H731_9NEOP